MVAEEAAAVVVDAVVTVNLAVAAAAVEVVVAAGVMVQVALEVLRVLIVCVPRGCLPVLKL